MKIIKSKNHKQAQILDLEGMQNQLSEQYVKQLAEIGNSLGEAVVKGKISREEAIQRLEAQSSILVQKIIDEKIKELSTTGQEIRKDIDSFEQTNSQIPQ